MIGKVKHSTGVELKVEKTVNGQEVAVLGHRLLLYRYKHDTIVIYDDDNEALAFCNGIASVNGDYRRMQLFEGYAKIEFDIGYWVIVDVEEEGEKCVVVGCDYGYVEFPFSDLKLIDSEYQIASNAGKGD